MAPGPLPVSRRAARSSSGTTLIPRFLTMTSPYPRVRSQARIGLRPNGTSSSTAKAEPSLPAAGSVSKAM